MDKEIKQNVVQFDLLSVPPRMIVQFIENDEENQIIVNYSDLSDDEKNIFDLFKNLSISKM